MLKVAVLSIYTRDKLIDKHIFEIPVFKQLRKKAEFTAFENPLL